MADAAADSVTADTGTETGGESVDDVRAAFIAGTLDEAGDAKAAAGKALAKDDEADEQADDDADADLDDDVEAAADEDDEPEVEASADEEDPDADLDDEPEVKAKADPEVAKRLDQVRKTDQRLREQREQLFAKREREIDEREKSFAPRLEKLAQFEKLAERARYEPELVLSALGLTEDDFEHVGRRVYAFTKQGKADPKVRDAVDRLTKEREDRDKLTALEKKLADRDAAEKKAAAEAEERKAIDHHVDRFVKAASEKTPLAKAYLAKNPARARVDLEVVAGRLIQQTGVLPEPKAVMIAFEKERRQVLRDHGIDPKSRNAAASAANTVSTAKTTPKPGDKKTAEKPKKAASDHSSLKEQFVRGVLD